MSSNATPPSYAQSQQQATGTSNQQAQYNKDSAITQSELNQTNQVTPFGNLTYTQIGTNPDGTPRFQATQSLSPQNQALYDQFMALSGKYGQTGNQLMDSVSSTYSKPFDFNAATASNLADMQKTFLDPQWTTQQNQLDNKLANQGINPGSDAWNTQMQQFNDAKSRAYNQMYTGAYQTAEQAALQQRQEPLSELSAFRSGTQPQGMQFTQTPQSSVAAPDYTGAVNSANQAAMQQYQAQMQQQNAMMGGLFGLAAAPLSSSGFWNTAAPAMAAAV